MAGNVYDDLPDYMDYLARRFPGEYGQSISGLLNSPPQGTIPVAPGAPAPALAPPINIPPGPPPGAPQAEPEVASSTTAPAPSDAAPAGQDAGSGLMGLAKQLMGQAGKTQGLPFPDLAKIQPADTGPVRPLPLTLPKFG